MAAKTAYLQTGRIDIATKQMALDTLRFTRGLGMSQFGVDENGAPVQGAQSGGQSPGSQTSSNGSSPQQPQDGIADNLPFPEPRGMISSPATRQAIAMTYINPAMGRSLMQTPAVAGERAKQEALDKGNADVEQSRNSATKMNYIADQLESELDKRQKENPSLLAAAIGPQNVDATTGKLNDFLAGRANMLNYPAIGGALNYGTSMAQIAAGIPSARNAYGVYNSLRHISGMVPAVFRGAGGTDQAQSTVDDLLTRTLSAPNYAEAKDIIKQFKQGFLPAMGSRSSAANFPSKGAQLQGDTHGIPPEIINGAEGKIIQGPDGKRYGIRGGQVIPQ